MPVTNPARSAINPTLRSHRLLSIHLRNAPEIDAAMEEVFRITRARGISRSQFFVEAMMEKIERDKHKQT